MPFDRGELPRGWPPDTKSGKNRRTTGEFL
jgi:hypothetical protein